MAPSKLPLDSLPLCPPRALSPPLVLTPPAAAADPALALAAPLPPWLAGRRRLRRCAMEARSAESAPAERAAAERAAAESGGGGGKEWSLAGVITKGGPCDADGGGALPPHAA